MGKEGIRRLFWRFYLKVQYAIILTQKGAVPTSDYGIVSLCMGKRRLRT